MPFPNFDPLAEGEALTAASLNSKLQDTRASLNALPEDALVDSALRAEHLAPITVSNLCTDAVGNAVNMTHVNPTPTVLSGNYDNEFTSTPATVPNSRGTFLGWGPGLGGTGWAGISAVNIPPSDTMAQLVFPLPGLTIMPTTGTPTSSQLCTGLLVKANVSVLMCPSNATSSSRYFDGMGLALFWQGGSGTYHYLPASVAFKGRGNALVADIATTALITSADLASPFGGAAAETFLFSVGAAVCRFQTPVGSLHIREWRISAVPIYGGGM